MEICFADVIEERARGDADKAQDIRAALAERVGTDIRAVAPGSPEAERLKAALIADGLWSQYLEVAIGPDAEIFTKAPVLSSVGWGDYLGVRSDSDWNNPEPEIVIVCDGAGVPRGAALGNDVNLRDFEGRSALLLGKAKDKEEPRKGEHMQLSLNYRGGPPSLGLKTRRTGWPTRIASRSSTRQLPRACLAQLVHHVVAAAPEVVGSCPSPRERRGKAVP